ncbi:MAG TPA: G1 family glutamic endopeptidase [Ktedonobacteraceae bacterium]|nr:G1 family glutamic endopeptidase [Ktedonobacteraceae bacterium]
MEKRQPIGFLKRNMLLLGVSLVVVSLLISIFHIVSLHNAHASSLAPMTVQQLAASGEAKCLQPPQHSNLKTLSDTQLIEYGLPPHAVIDQDLAQWQQALASAGHRSCGTTPTGSGRTHLLQPSQQKVQPNASLPTQFITNWSGYVVHAARGTYKAAEVTFKVPTLKAGAKGAHVSIWAGIGDGSSPFSLVQAGVDSTLNANGKQSNVSWWEVVSNSPGNTSFPEENLPLAKGLHNGDDIWVYVSSNPSNDGFDLFYIENKTTHDYNSHTLLGGQDLSDSASGECVVERPSIGGGLSSLANFGTEAMSQCDLYVDGNAALKPIGDFNSQKMVMVNNKSTYDLDAVSALTGGQNFTVTYLKPN